MNRTHEGLLKWKYPEMNSVDFLFEVCVAIVSSIVALNGLFVFLYGGVYFVIPNCAGWQC